MTGDVLLDEVEPNVLRHRNRALTTEVRKLRASHRDLVEEGDAAFLAIGEVETEAERALRELWEQGEFDCSPQDYEAIVERCLAALKWRETRYAQKP